MMEKSLLFSRHKCNLRSIKAEISNVFRSKVLAVGHINLKKQLPTMLDALDFLSYISCSQGSNMVGSGGKFSNFKS